MSRGEQSFKPKLIFQHTAARISGIEAEAILCFTVDKRRAFWLRAGTVYVYPWGAPNIPWTIISYEDYEEAWRPFSETTDGKRYLTFVQESCVRQSAAAGR